MVYDRGIDSLASVFTDTLSEDAFWHGVWQTLTKNFDADNIFVSKMFHAEIGLLSFFKHYAVVPTGLASSTSPALVRMDKIKFMASKVLSQKSIIQHLEKLPKLEELLKNRSIVSNGVGKVIQKMYASERLVVEKSVNELFSEMLEEDGQDKYLSPNNANLLETFYNDKLKELIGSNKDDLVESYNITHIFDRIFVKVKNGAHQPLSEVLFTNPQSQDEQLVSKFTPEEYLLSSEYDESAIDLLKRIRTGTPFSIQKLLTWIKREDVKESKQKQKAVVEYLLRSDNSKQLFEQIKFKRSPRWLINLIHKNFSEWGFSGSDWIKWKDELKSNAEMEQEYREQYSIPVNTSSLPPNPLTKIYNWWVSEGQEKYLAAYEKKLIPASLDFIKLQLGNDFDANEMWLKLLFLASCQTIGRVQDEQNKGAIEFFDQKNWWDIFLNTDNAQEWFNVLDDYLESSFNEEVYRQWLQVLPLYRFSKYLDDYIEIFISAIDHGIDQISDITKPAQSKLLAGSGLSYPTLESTLGIGINFVLRELIRNKVYESNQLDKYCYVVSQGVLDILYKLNIEIDEPIKNKRSECLYQILIDELSEDKATFDGSFDIPFRILARDEDLFQRVIYS